MVSNKIVYIVVVDNHVDHYLHETKNEAEDAAYDIARKKNTTVTVFKAVSRYGPSNMPILKYDLENNGGVEKRGK